MNTRLRSKRHKQHVIHLNIISSSLCHSSVLQLSGFFYWSWSCHTQSASLSHTAAAPQNHPSINSPVPITPLPTSTVPNPELCVPDQNFSLCSPVSFLPVCDLSPGCIVPPACSSSNWLPVQTPVCLVYWAKLGLCSSHYKLLAKYHYNVNVLFFDLSIWFNCKDKVNPTKLEQAHGEILGNIHLVFWSFLLPNLRANLVYNYLWLLRRDGWPHWRG